MIQSPHYTEEHEDFRKRFRAFLASEVTPRWPAILKDGKVPPDIWLAAGRAGFLCTKVSPLFGGGGGNLYHCLVILEEQSRACVNDIGFYLHSDIIAPYIEFYGTAEQKARYLPRMARGEIVAAIAMTEPGGGSDLQAMRTTALPQGDSFILNGQKVFTSHGQIAGLICVAAKSDPNRSGKGISLFLIETDKVEGFARGRNFNKAGSKAQDSSELFFDHVRLDRDSLLGGEEGRGFQQLMLRLAEERLIVAMSAVANMEDAVEETTVYLGARYARGQRLLDAQGTRLRLAECKTTAVMARTFLTHCIDTFIEGALTADTAAMAKWWMTERVCEVLEVCLELCSGDDEAAELTLASRLADQRVGRIGGGTTEIMKEIIGRTLG